MLTPIGIEHVSFTVQLSREYNLVKLSHHNTHPNPCTSPAPLASTPTSPVGGPIRLTPMFLFIQPA